LAQNPNFCLPHLYSTPPLGGFPSEYYHDVWYEKNLEWCGYLTVKKIGDTIIPFDRIHECDKTNRHRMTA